MIPGVLAELVGLEVGRDKEALVKAVGQPVAVDRGIDKCTVVREGEDSGARLACVSRWQRGRTECALHPACCEFIVASAIDGCWWACGAGYRK
jgi:hypothetical protein